MNVTPRRTTLLILLALAFAPRTFAQEAATAEAPGAAAPGTEVARSDASKSDAAKREFFEKRVRPLLVNNCYACHSADTNSKGGLRVDDRNGLIAGGGRGSAVAPGDPERSLLLKAVSHADKGLRMPPGKKLEEEEIADLTLWIRDGAFWPAVEIPADLGKSAGDYKLLKETHWAWQPRTTPNVPDVRNAAWPRSDVDRFILAKLEEKNLAPAGDADRVSLLRRVSFDLTGLPPTPAEITAFVDDASPNAFEAVVDRLLASPAYGERWGRHWLDVARFGESTGSSRNLPTPHAWRYRDYVINAFNKDKPYDRFVTEQVAGDLLEPADQAEREENVIATGFLAIGVKDVNQRFKVRFVMDNVDEQIDAVSRAFLGLTASCARCHDHKFDPIPAADYYALAGIFTSTDLCTGLRNKMGGGGMDYYDTNMLISLNPGAKPDPAIAEKIEETKAALKAARDELASVRDGLPKDTAPPEREKTLQPLRQKANKLQGELTALNDPALIGPIAYGLRDAKQIGDTEIRIRGEAEKLGPKVPRGFLTTLPGGGPAHIVEGQSGRVELARWLTDGSNPLTARVMVNRVWHHLFGRGIVQTVDNFGVMGDVPTHPELLDHLSNQFVREGWSVKRLVRSIVLSRSYQLSADASRDALNSDPANRFVWRHSPRRLEAEEIRDATLAASGALSLAAPQGSLGADFKVTELLNNGAEARKLMEKARASTHRSVYLPLLRGIVPTSLEVFDFAEQGMVTGSRDATTVSPQALYLLNDPFVRRHALTLAERLIAAEDLDDVQRMERAYALVLGRQPTQDEVDRGLQYLAEYEAILAELEPRESTAAADVNAANQGLDEQAKANPANAEAKLEPKRPGARRKAKGGKNGQAQQRKKEAAAAEQAATEALAGSQAGKPAEDAAIAETPAGIDANSSKEEPAAPSKPKPAPQPVNPDEADQSGAPVSDESIQPANSRTTAWASFIQALLGSAEFRYLK